MPCLVGVLALLFPRVAVFVVWLLGGDYLTRAYDHWIWPLAGFFLFPLTTLAFAYAVNSLGGPGQMTPFGWLLVALAAAADLGIVGGGRQRAKRWEEERRGDR